jgi:hypothetical protein
MKLTSLGNGNQIVTLQNGWDRVGLNGRRDLVTTKTNIAKHDRVETCIVEVDNWCRSLGRLRGHLDLLDTASC